MVGVFEKREASSFAWLHQASEFCVDPAAEGLAFSEEVFENLSPLTKSLYNYLCVNEAIYDALHEDDFHLNRELPSILSRHLMRLFCQGDALLLLNDGKSPHKNLQDYLTATYEAILHSKNLVPGSPECRILRTLLDGELKHFPLALEGPAFIANEELGHVIFLKAVSVIVAKEEDEIRFWFRESPLEQGKEFAPAFTKLLAAIHTTWEIGIKAQSLYNCGSYKRTIGEAEPEIRGIIKAVHRYNPELLATPEAIINFDFDEQVLRFRDRHILLGA